VEAQDDEEVPVTITETLRERRPTLRAFPGDQWLERLGKRVGTTSRPLAQPPAGSGLEPVHGEPGLPYLGKSLDFLRHGMVFSADYRDKYGDVFWTNSFGRRAVWVLSPEGAKEVLTTRAKSFSQAGWRFFIEAFFNRGLMLLDGEEHKLHRRIMQEAFNRPRLEAYAATFSELIEKEIANWPVNQPMELNTAVKTLSLGVATVVFMGADQHASDHLTQAFVDAVRGGTALVRVKVPGMPFLRWNKGLEGRRVLEEYFREQIPAKRASDGSDLFTALCHAVTDEGEQFSDDDIVNHMIFLLMAAHDTTTITSTTIAYYLAKHPELQERARAESEALRGEPITLDLLSHLNTVDLVFQEGMRMVAPVPGLVREAAEDTEICGRFVPKGTLISVVSDAVHRAPESWSDAASFDIDRFLAPREEQKSHRFAHLPFGGGAHKCIGMAFGSAEVKTILHTLLLNYRIEIPADYVLEWDYTSLVVPVDGFPVTLRPVEEA
jgi:cytochrome P450